MIPCAVGRLDGLRQRSGPTHRPVRRLREAVRVLGETAAFDELQRQERPAVLLANVIDLDDVGMLQPRDGLGLGVEAGDLGRAGMAARQDHLERDLAIEADVPCAVDHAHPAATELGQELVAGHDRTRTGRGRLAIPGRPPVRRAQVGQLQEPTRLERPMHIEQGAQPLGKGGESPHIFFQLRCFTQLLAQQNFAVDELERPLGVSEQPRILVEEILDRNPVARQPAPARFGSQLADQFGQRQFLGHRLQFSLRANP